MIKKSLRSVAVVFKYAPGLTLLKLVQIALSAVLAPLSIYFTQRMIDSIVRTVSGGAQNLAINLDSILLWGGLLLFSMFFSSVGGGFFNGILYIAIRRRLNIMMTPVFLEKFRRLDYPCFEDREVLDTLERMSSEPQNQMFQLFLTIIGVFQCAIEFIGAAVIFSQAGWWFVPGFAGLLVPMIILDFKAADMMNAMFNNQSEDERKMHYLGGLLANKAPLYELKVFRATDYILEKWRGISKDVLDTRVKTTMHAQKYFLLSTALFKLWSFFVVLSLVYSVIGGNITIGIFTALIASTGAVLDNADTLSHVMQNLRKRHLLMEHYYKFLALPEAPEGGERLTGREAHIIFDDVHFAYPGTDSEVLRGVSFEVKPGERVALVGENGAGKSTIIKLLCRLYRPDSGRIQVNGHDLCALDATELHRIFSVVFQDYCRYSLTLRENVALGDIGKIDDDDALYSALKMGMAGEIAPLDTPLGKLEEDGIDLSGGQWQRIAVARACLPDSAFIILDEPTASLDPVAESEMYHSFAEVLKNRGCIMISHRLASAKMADKIVVLADGAVCESGRHGDLMAADGLYAKMFRSQSAWYVRAPQGGGVK